MLLHVGFITFYLLIKMQINSKNSPMGMAVGMPEMKGTPATVDLAKNPLAETHEFKQACAICFVRTGEFFFLNLVFTL